MANLNRVMLIGRLTRDPETRTFASGGKVAHFGFAVNNRRKNAQTQQWEDEPVFIDVEAFNRGDYGKLADNVEHFFSKGKQFFIEGRLKLDQWTGQDGQKRSKLKVVMENFQFLEPRPEGQGGGMARSSSPASVGGPAPAYEESPPAYSDAPEGPETHQEGDIPF